MKSVLISIQPQWCELIASGKKTIEVRKTAPKGKEPFKVYIYQTKKKWIYRLLEKLGLYQGKVIGEFVCDSIIEFNGDALEMCYQGRKLYNIDLGEEFFKGTCVSYKEAHRYFDKNDRFCRDGYGWHISDLKIYDKPKELREFWKHNFEEIYSRWEDLFSIGVAGCGAVVYPPEPREEDYKLTRPPQSWCYVEEL